MRGQGEKNRRGGRKILARKETEEEEEREKEKTKRKKRKIRRKRDRKRIISAEGVELIAKTQFLKDFCLIKTPVSKYNSLNCCCFYF